MPVSRPGGIDNRSVSVADTGGCQRISHHQKRSLSRYSRFLGQKGPKSGNISTVNECGDAPPLDLSLLLDARSNACTAAHC